jgi:hypothetical protein
MPAVSVACPPDPAQILLVEYDDDLSDVLCSVVAEGGYRAHRVASPAQAVDQIDAQTFDLVLADCDRDGHLDLATDRMLWRGVWPTPLGLLTREPPEKIQGGGFAFAQRLPFDLDTFLDTMAWTLDQSRTPVPQREAEAARRFFAAREAQDWPALLALCTKQVTLSPCRSAAPAALRNLMGKSAVRAYLKAEARAHQQLRFDRLLLYPTRRGLVARTTISWVTAEGHPEQAAGTTVFAFSGERICRIGCAVGMARLRRRLMDLEAERRWRRAQFRVSQTRALVSAAWERLDEPSRLDGATSGRPAHALPKQESSRLARPAVVTMPRPAYTPH